MSDWGETHGLSVLTK